MADERASEEEQGNRDIARLRQIYLEAFAKAHDIESLNEACTRVAVEIQTTVHDLFVRWGTLSAEKAQYLKGVTKAVVDKHVPQLLRELEKRFAGGERTALFAAVKLCAE